MNEILHVSNPVLFLFQFLECFYCVFQFFYYWQIIGAFFFTFTAAHTLIRLNLQSVIFKLAVFRHLISDDVVFKYKYVGYVDSFGTGLAVTAPSAKICSQAFNLFVYYIDRKSVV